MKLFSIAKLLAAVALIATTAACADPYYGRRVYYYGPYPSPPVAYGPVYYGAPPPAPSGAPGYTNNWFNYGDPRRHEICPWSDTILADGRRHKNCIEVYK